MPGEAFATNSNSIGNVGTTALRLPRRQIINYPCHPSVGKCKYDNCNDNESNFIGVNYTNHIIGDVQASSWIRNKLVFMYIHLHCGIINTHVLRIAVYGRKNNIIMHYSSPTMQLLYSEQTGPEAVLWAPISIEMKNNIGRVQKNKANVQVQNTVCIVGAQQILIHLLLTALCSFYVRSVDQYSLQPSDIQQQHRSESNFGSDTGLMSVSIKLMLTYHQCRSAPIYTMQF